MASTGEAACFGQTRHDAFLESFLFTGFRLPKQKRVAKRGRPLTLLVALGPVGAKCAFLDYTHSLMKMGCKLTRTKSTHALYVGDGFECELAVKQRFSTLFQQKLVDIFVNYLNLSGTNDALTDGYHMRRQATDLGIPLFTYIKLAQALVQALERIDPEKMPVYVRGRTMPCLLIVTWRRSIRFLLQRIYYEREQARGRIVSVGGQIPNYRHLRGPRALFLDVRTPLQ